MAREATARDDFIHGGPAVTQRFEDRLFGSGERVREGRFLEFGLVGKEEPEIVEDILG
jgi:hypothetical protein